MVSAGTGTNPLQSNKNLSSGIRGIKPVIQITPTLTNKSESLKSTVRNLGNIEKTEPISMSHTIPSGKSPTARYLSSLSPKSRTKFQNLIQRNLKMRSNLVTIGNSLDLYVQKQKNDQL
jgi:hypothetical protein